MNVKFYFFSLLAALFSFEIQGQDSSSDRFISTPEENVKNIRHLEYITPVISKEDLYQNLRNQFYIQVPFSIDQKYIQQAQEAFFLFLQQNEDVKNTIQFDLSSTHRRSDVGYQRRRNTAPQAHDNKEFFHFHPAIFEKYAEFLDENPSVKDFMDKALLLWNAIYVTVYKLLCFIEQDYPGIINSVFNTKYPHIIIRFLKYDWENAGKNLAKAHFDASSFTLALAESNPGLRIGSCPEDLCLVSHKDDHALFMLGINVNQLIKDSTFKPGWHDVIQLDQTNIGRPCARWAIVGFIEGQTTPDTLQTDTHKWKS